MPIHTKPLKNSLPLLAIILMSVFAPLTARAQTVSNEISSAYTKINLEDCHFITQAELGLPELTEEEMGVGSASWLCKGYNDSIVYVAEGDLRMFVSFGPDALQERAANQTMPAFNTISETLEWRVRKVNGAWVPFATILRWHTQVGDGSEPDGEILIVTKLEPGNTCHIAYIDTHMPALANQNFNPNEIARNFADEAAKNFDCETQDPYYYPS